MSERELLIALGRTKRPVKVLAEDDTLIATLPPELALAVARESHYRGVGATKHRVRAIRRCKPREYEPIAVRDDAYRAGLPIIQPSIEWSRRMGYGEWQRRLECA